MQAQLPGGVCFVARLLPECCSVAQLQELRVPAGRAQACAKHLGQWQLAADLLVADSEVVLQELSLMEGGLCYPRLWRWTLARSVSQLGRHRRAGCT